MKITNKGLKKYIGQEIHLWRQYISKHKDQRVFSLFIGNLFKKEGRFGIEDIKWITHCNYRHPFSEEDTRVNKTPKLKKIDLKTFIEGEDRTKDKGDSIEIHYPYTDPRNNNTYNKSVHYDYI
ncbi:hypothetical protein GOV13_03825 [Candidatus Pacearchaeota archaeon]|nr:hypothetical protein [Candidatus Pacearchaeota archaeon]